MSLVSTASVIILQQPWRIDKTKNKKNLIIGGVCVAALAILAAIGANLPENRQDETPSATTTSATEATTTTAESSTEKTLTEKIIPTTSVTEAAAPSSENLLDDEATKELFVSILKETCKKDSEIIVMLNLTKKLTATLFRLGMTDLLNTLCSARI